MSNESKTAPSKLLYTLYIEKKWFIPDNESIALTYSEFKRIFMDRFETIPTNKICKEKWDELIEWGYFRTESDDSSVVMPNLDDMRKKFDDCDLRHDFGWFLELERTMAREGFEPDGHGGYRRIGEQN